jgi:hypothetical protein
MRYERLDEEKIVRSLENVLLCFLIDSLRFCDQCFASSEPCSVFLSGKRQLKLPTWYFLIQVIGNDESWGDFLISLLFRKVTTLFFLLSS